MRRIQIRPGADQDLDEVADHYVEVGGLDLALRFLDSVEETCNKLREYPEIGQTCLYADPRREGVRRWHVRAPFDT